MRIRNFIKFTAERYMVRGAGYQLLAVALLIGLVAVGGGLLLRVGVADAGTPSESIWWAFLRLTDPGYLGDDAGIVRRIIATVITILGYVLFMGSLVAIMTTWLNNKIRELESGYTPIVRNDHVLVLGWTARGAIVIRDLLHSEGRVRRFLRRLGASRLHVVMLADEVNAELMDELGSRVGPRWDPNQVTLRSGSALRSDHLARVDFLHAGVVLLPAGEFSDAGAEQADARTIKTLLSMSNHPSVESSDDLPYVVAEVLDERKAETAAAAYRGPVEILSSDVVVSRLIAQNVQHRGLSHVYNELLTHREGAEIYLRDVPDLVGERWDALRRRFDRAVPLGVVRRVDGNRAPHLNPPEDFVLEGGDRLVLLASEYDDTEAGPARQAEHETDASAVPKRQSQHGGRRVLIVGWSHKVPALLKELSTWQTDALVVDVASLVDISERETTLRRHVGELSGVVIQQLDVDATAPRELVQLEPHTYDNIIFMGSDWLHSGEESDARTIVSYLLMQNLLAKQKKRPALLVELLDATNVGLLGERPGDVLISPVILSHMMTQVGLRRELSTVFDTLFASGGAEITLRSADAYGYDGTSVTFERLAADAAQQGETALGWAKRDDRGKVELWLNPDRQLAHQLGSDDDLVVLVTRGDREQRAST